MNIPNTLTIFRLILIPFFVKFFFSESDDHFLNAFIVFMVAGITDILDGFIARTFNQITELGKILDPIADKLMLIAVLVCLVSTGLVPSWILIIILIKEFVMVGISVFLYFPKRLFVIPANIYGKVATLLFFLAVCFILLEANVAISNILLYSAVGVALFAFSYYLRLAIIDKIESNR